ncbi:uncharacterized protein LOC124267565 [Haliotis rubra]|uniref:uncharacterized protein LOC124267565 n=1 Tax=Haliotis rubra TaxID=36100 RepID=UPI001EE51269|nr:uncharacterized protein LOC124267565 [Haliotis rubra]
MKCSLGLDYLKTLVCVYVVLSVVDCRRGRRAKRGNGKCGGDSLAEYNLSFFGDWAKEAFPRMYPKYRPHAQWSKLYGLTHGRTYKMWSAGELASHAVKKFVEERSTLLLDRQVQGYNDTFDIFTAAPLRGGVGRTSSRIFADGKHSKISFLVKIIPSPDWFVGVDGLDLCRNGRWRRKVYAHLRPMDAGTDKGLTYTSPNWPSHPPQRIFEITPSYPDHPASSFFYPDRNRLPRIAHAILEKVTEYQQQGRATDVKYNSMPSMVVERQPHELSHKSWAPKEAGAEEIAINTKIDQALKEKLEKDIQNRLKTSPRRTFFLQRMVRKGGHVLADQSSEEVDEEVDEQGPHVGTRHGDTEVKAEESYLTRRDPYVDVSTTSETPPTPAETTTQTYRLVGNVNSLTREHGLETVRNTMEEEEDNDSEEAAKSELMLQPTYLMSKGSDEGGDDVSVEQDSQKMGSVIGEESEEPNSDTQDASAQIHEKRHQYYTGSPIEQNSDRGHSYNIDQDVDERSTARPIVYDHTIDTQVEEDVDKDEDVVPDYAAAYSAGRVKAGATQGYRDDKHIEDVDVIQSSQTEKPYRQQRPYTRTPLVNRQVDSDVDNNSPTYVRGGANDVEKDTWGESRGDNVEKETDQSKALETLGIFRPNSPLRGRKTDEQLDCLVTEWSPWSSCSLTCGFGVSTRTRQVTQHARNGGLNCPRLSVEKICGSMRTCKWNYFNSLFNKNRGLRRRRRRRRHHRG